MNLSIVIPALNEAAALPATLDAVAQHATGAEVVVVDAGSHDGTAEAARSHRSRPRVIAGGQQLTRGAALNAGVAAATGDVLWFLHADTTPPEGCAAQVATAMGDPSVVGGAFEFGFVERGWKLRVVEIVNRIRYRLRQRYYGDQGIFVRRETFDKLGGFRECGLMEDAHFCRDARRLGRLRLIKRVLPTSARRFLAGGVFTAFWLDIRIWWLDALGRDVQRFAEQYRAANLDPSALTTTPGRRRQPGSGERHTGDERELDRLANP